MNNKIFYALIGLVIGVISTIFIYPSISKTSTTMMNEKTTQASDTLDAHFIEQMIPHHEDAIAMAKLAQIKAQRPEVKTLSNNIVTSQGKEITQMKNWYKEWFGRVLPTGNKIMQHHGMMSSSSSMHMGMMGTDQDMEKLSNASDFDTVFVEEMIPHHQMAVMMAGMLKDGTQRPEMKKLADEIIKAQTAEVEQMRSWLTKWNK
ncbi:MAG: DUF305 domain-containing protein [Candidatus Levybacteria bacterium]|nr:DUF305 domain-containing protein [Candidatus Levybacteria bacterium]MBP9815160.1 DUF305 domain-containing protein [Candidatus Levybacteria bacterium]